MRDLIIVGSGPAGLCAAIYGKRAGFDTLVIEETGVSGGQILQTYEVDNYPGLPGISGFDLGMKMREHADKMGAEFLDATVTGLKDNEDFKTIITNEGELETRAVIIATGAAHNKLQVPGEEELTGMGVSYCATCDGAFFKNKVTIVVGGGDVAVEDAIFLARTCSKVYLVHRRDSLRAAQILQQELFSMQNVEMIWDSTVEKICGDGQVESVIIKNVKSHESRTVETDGVFVAVGIHPNTEAFAAAVNLDASGYIQADETCRTNISGIFAAGDNRTKKLRQVVTAVSDGANAVTSATEYFSGKNS